MQNQLTSTCPICFPNRENSKFSAKLILKLTRVIMIQKSKTPNLNTLSIQIYFRQLIEYFSLEIKEWSQFSHNCLHNRLKDYLVKKIKITHEVLLALCQNIYKSISKRKFQFQLVQKISKNISVQIFSNPKVFNRTPSLKNKQESDNTQKQEKIQVTSASNLCRDSSSQYSMENQKQDQNIQKQLAVSPSPFQFSNFMGFPPILNNNNEGFHNFNTASFMLPNNPFQYSLYQQMFGQINMPLINNYFN